MIITWRNLRPMQKLFAGALALVLIPAGLIFALILLQIVIAGVLVVLGLSLVLSVFGKTLPQAGRSAGNTVFVVKKWTTGIEDLSMRDREIR